MNEEKAKFSLKVAVQRIGSALSSMVMPNIPILIAWGVITTLFIGDGWLPNPQFALLVGPMLAYLIPIMIGYTGGKNVYDHRGGVVGAIATMGAIVATQGSIPFLNTVSGMDPSSANFVSGFKDAVASRGTDVPMILAAMILGPLGAWVIKKFDAWAQPKVKAGLEMLVNNFSAGLIGFAMALIANKVVGPIIEALTKVMAHGVDFLISNHLIPLANLFIEPAKILFLNNAINHGILTPLGTEQVLKTGKSLLFLLEANPGPGLGVLLAFWFFGKGSAKATAPGAIIIHFIGGIHEIYFPYVMMKPALFGAVMAGGVTGTFVNNMLGSGLKAPASPGSIIAILSMTPKGLGNFAAVLAGVISAAIVSFLVAALILKNDKSMVDDSTLEAAQAELASNKAVAKGQTQVGTDTAIVATNIKHIIFACDAGMGSSAMGASILRDKVKKAGLTIDVTNRAIANLTDAADTLVVTQEELAPRAAQMAPSSTRVAVSNFLNSPKYEAIITSLTGSQTADQVVAVHDDVTNEIDLNLIDEVVFAHDATAIGSATMGKETINAIFKNNGVKIPVSDVEFLALSAYNAANIVVVVTQDNLDKAKHYAPNAQYLSVDSLITTHEYDKMVARMKK
ncbi:PTS transporter subunit EIIC [Lactococcus carnosus]|uniref:PTS system mannitol-specific EIICB component n=1 Tax=Pseudolactococcus carnosus TaxID=2749961 RepID=A0ABT0AU57_9LACT|nr:PTS transporter subunit EIIC [Lactococcus carnosus]SCA92686.1 PTS system Phosphotransferase system, mannitol-specific IIBC component [Lactococcus piscium]MCJ1969670.1 PTS transporter subunit EIIC [Lactococcus carnosus]MCJ1973296.1 PTS transporter subunit EIIC [Lactococcus carnosus]MCJ1975275.1 PTS transporter subunit EIIC [Lactococcus carnosus]MCJ1978948.1 PTS transporter subunit EIIC [Lactococcus carnosus]